MKIISWNAQGMKKTKNQALQEILFLKRMHKPNIMFILETMVSSTNIRWILPKTGFEHFDYWTQLIILVALQFWNNDSIHASILRKDQQAIHVLIHDTGNNQNVIVSGVYAPAQFRDKDPFWNQLIQFNSVVDLPWCLIGDFNEITSPGEKRREASDTPSRNLRD